jgi:hypothetical protein
MTEKVKDVLVYPSCKLNADGRFRLPNQIRDELIKARFLQVVILAVEGEKCIFVPISIWEKNKRAFPVLEDLKYHQRPQSLKKIYLKLCPELLKYLKNPQQLFLEHKSDHYLIYNENDYRMINSEIKKQLDELFENL